MDLSQQLELEQRRLQERSQIAHLQGQLEELRNRLDQQAGRAQLAVEQARQVQDMFAQLEARFEAMLGEAKLQEQTRQRAYQTMNKELAEMRLRMEEPARQLLNLIAQVQDLHELMRLLRENVAEGQESMNLLEQRMEDLRAQGLLREERLTRVDNMLGQMQRGEEDRQQTIRQMREGFDTERQNLRRQMAEIERLAADLRGERQEFNSRLNRLAELQREGAVTFERARESLDAVPAQLDRFTAELHRLERESVERSLQEQERLESLRQSTQREWGELREAEERRSESQNAWLRRIEELYHSLDERLARRETETGQHVVGLEERLEAIDRGGEALLRTLLDAFQKQLESLAEQRVRRTESRGEE